MTDLTFWQAYWFFIIGAAFFLFLWLDGFDLGIGMTLPYFKTGDQRATLLNVIWPLWDGNELYGLIGGGAIFATFPVVFTALLSGLYPWVTLLLVFVMLRPVAFEAWLHDVKARRLWEMVFSVSSFMIPFVAGVAFGGTMAGLPYNQDALWDPAHSFFEVLSPLSVLTGLAFVAISLVHGSAYLIRKAADDVAAQARKNLLPQLIVAAVVFVAVIVLMLLGIGGADRPLAVLIPAAIAVIAVGLVGTGVARTGNRQPFLWSSLTIFGGFLLIASFQFPVMIRSSLGAGNDLSIFKAGVSNPVNSLSFIGLLGLVGLAVVLVYTILVYRLFKGKVDHKANAHY